MTRILDRADRIECLPTMQTKSNHLDTSCLFHRLSKLPEATPPPDKGFVFRISLVGDKVSETSDPTDKGLIRISAALVKAL
jgi:hypothetical protein